MSSSSRSEGQEFPPPRPLKILYYYGRLNVGGAERSSVRLVNALVQRGHRVDLLLKWQGGALERELDPRVKIIALKKANRLTEMYSGRRWKGIPVMRPDVFAARLGQLVRSALIKLYLRILKSTYDLALVGYHGLDPIVVLRSCRADVYGMMMRSTASVTDHERRSAYFLRDPLRKLDAYICVSQFVRLAMIENYPDLANKAVCIYNVLPKIDDQELHELPVPYRDQAGLILILTLCRMDAEPKGLFRMVAACRALVERYPGFRWLVVGDGKDKEALREKILEAGLEGTMILCPKVEDPYPYYQHADLVAVLSRHEGLSGVVNEAKMMRAPLIATRFSSIEEQVVHGVNGFIVENNLQAIVDGMSVLLTDHELRKSLACNGMPEALLDNDAKVRQFEALTLELSERKRSNQREPRIGQG